MSDARWLALVVACPSADSAALIAEGLVAFGGSAVEELDGAVRTYLRCPEEQDAHALVARVTTRLAGELDGTPAVTWHWLEDTDWNAAWRRGLGPRRVGRHFVVAPTWTEPELQADDVLLSIDPEMAFGTGEHGTTRGMLRLLETTMRPGMRVLDVGTGSAILAIAAARLGAAHVDAVESDEDALINARDNVDRHAVARRVTLIHALADDAWLAERRYDLVLANILSSVIRPLLPAFARALPASGDLLVSGILQGEADAVLADAHAAGFALREEDREDEWWSGALIRR